MIDSYKEIVQAIKLHTSLYTAANIEYEYYNAILHNRNPKDIIGMSYDSMPKAEKNQMDLKDAIPECQRWLHIMQIEQDQIDRLNEQKQIMDDAIDGMQDISIKVAQLRAIGLTQEQVAEIVDRSARQVQRIEDKMSCKVSC